MHQRRSKFDFNFFLKVFTTSFSSFFLRRPVFINTHFNFLPIALFNKNATTLLSTPPDKAHMTFSFFTLFLISLIIKSFLFSKTPHFFCMAYVQYKIT